MFLTGKVKSTESALRGRQGDRAERRGNFREVKSLIHATGYEQTGPSVARKLADRNKSALKLHAGLLFVLNGGMQVQMRLPGG